MANNDWIDGKGRTVAELRTLKRIKPGTVLDLVGHSEPILIGTVNELLGVCDDCREFDPAKTVVKRLRHLTWKDA